MTRNEFNDIIDRDYRRLFRTAYSILNNRQEAEDVVQDVYLRMWMMKEKLDEYDDPTALAVTMTRNNSIDLMREISGLSYEEISAQKGLNINNLRVIISRARQLIRDNYIKYTNERGKA